MNNVLCGGRWLALLLMLGQAQAFDERALWLPASYLDWMSALHEQAEAVEAQAQCQQVMKGTLQQRNSTREHPIFSFVCRDPERKTFSLTVDGLSGEITYLNPARAVGAGNLQALTEERRKLSIAAKAHLEAALPACNAGVEAKTRYMNQLSWVNWTFIGPVEIPLPEPELPSADSLVVTPTSYWQYSRAFDAQDAQGNPLYFEVLCLLDEHGEAEIKIARRLSPAEKKAAEAEAKAAAKKAAEEQAAADAAAQSSVDTPEQTVPADAP